MGSGRRLRPGGPPVRWFKDNVGTVAGWIGMAAMLLVGAVTQWTAAQTNQAHAKAELSTLKATTSKHETELVAIRSDVRSTREQLKRMDEVVTRQEGAVRDLEKLTTEIRAIVRARE